MRKKYEITDSKIKYNGTILRRIKALKDFSDVKKGDLGGWVQSESNLSQEGDCWIYDNAKVYDDAKIKDNAIIGGESNIHGYAKIYDNSKIHNSKVCEFTSIKGNSYITDCIISGYSIIENSNINLFNLKHCKAVNLSYKDNTELQCLIGKGYAILDISNIKKITKKYFDKIYTFYKIKDIIYASNYVKSFKSVTLRKLFDKLFKASKYDIDEIRRSAKVLSEILEEFDLPLNMGINNKYVLSLDDIIEYNSKPLFRIIYLKDFKDIPNKLGGYVSNYSTLDGHNNNVICPNSIVLDSKIYEGNIINSVIIKSKVFRTIVNSNVYNSNIYNLVVDSKINKSTVLHRYNKVFTNIIVSNYIGDKFINQKVNEVDYTFYMKTFGKVVGCFYEDGKFKEVYITKLRNSIKNTNKLLALTLDSIANKLK